MPRRKHICRLNQADASVSRAIWTLYQSAYQSEAELLGVEDFAPLNRSCEEIQTTPSAFNGFFEIDSLAAVSEAHTDGTCLSIDGFAVYPRFYRKGIGSELLRYILDESSCRSAVVETAAANEPAICFYARFGFTEIDRWETAEGIQLVRLGANLPSD